MPLAAEQVTVVSGVAEERQTVFSLLVKRSYRIVHGKTLVRREDVKPFRVSDAYHAPGDPETSTVLHEDELAPYKPATDVVVICQAHAPDGRPVQTMTIGVEVAGRQKVLRVTGDRAAAHRARTTPVVTDPAPFLTMPIRYELAYGGSDARSVPGRPFRYPRNPLGRGLALRNVREAVEGLPLPNIESPDDILSPERIVLEDASAWNRQPLPQGFGWFQKGWYPRCSFVGAVPGNVTANETMREEQLGLVPRGQITLARQFRLPSFDVRFNNGASLGLVTPALPSGALIRLARLTEEGMLSFTLPDTWPSLMLDIGLGENVLPAALHTVAIDVEQGCVDLIWRGAHPYPGHDWLPEMRRLRWDVQ
jgi:hypothetical protein